MSKDTSLETGIIVDPPMLSAPIEEWEAFLASLEKPPRNKAIEIYIEDAKKVIADRKAGLTESFP